MPKRKGNDKEGLLRDEFEEVVKAVGGEATDENFIKWLVARHGEEQLRGGKEAKREGKLSKSKQLQFNSDFNRILLERCKDGRLDPLLNVNDQKSAVAAFKTELLGEDDIYDGREVGRRIRASICDHRIFWRYGPWVSVAQRGEAGGSGSGTRNAPPTHTSKAMRRPSRPL